MPVVTRALVKTAMAWLVVALFLLALQALPLAESAPQLVASRAAAWHLLTVGWLTQLVFGVAYWLFPRPPGGFSPRGDALAWAQVALLNAGLGLRLIAEPLSLLHPDSAWHVALPLSAALQWLAAVAFTVATWPRVRGK